ncbi:MAG: 50S ribosomal protein L27 [Parcubacteria group bacterium GW2011_GWA2_46_7]|nr:MAG: 50S ribosomal protein L27 [Parcubacteria group bacterium GW2011_GWA1_45_7]KKU10721.1 MAG: 50S ribosomal protein L27 [Parcubacteria group bacterium GW2011_GWF1_45_5]KKU43306.1 MAG: 50S ribosomal protein L27 [Parcubacteria group bacterium GW2011_GWA2_46_7]KKU46944.1 MAG: 50S ribosomal protein L27 [Parcubacteria group bacterium GW2011_GWF2_46_8]OHD12192.1 MAG: 50S ribosomal protein L27 [Spirochaetes bacterium GWB1_48_6]
MAHTKAGSSSKNLRDSNPKYLGLKAGNNQHVRSGAILVRQRGTLYEKGVGVSCGSDDTLYATKEGRVMFYRRKTKSFNGRVKEKTFVKVI